MGSWMSSSPVVRSVLSSALIAVLASAFLGLGAGPADAKGGDRGITRAAIFAIHTRAKDRHGAGTDAYYEAVGKGFEQLFSPRHDETGRGIVDRSAGYPRLQPSEARRDGFLTRRGRALVDNVLRAAEREERINSRLLQAFDTTGRRRDHGAVGFGTAGGDGSRPSISGNLRESIDAQEPRVEKMTGDIDEATVRQVGEIGEAINSQLAGLGSGGGVARILPFGWLDKVKDKARSAVAGASRVTRFGATVALSGKTPSQQDMCSGTLIASNKNDKDKKGVVSGAVLTAAHCLCDGKRDHVYFGFQLFKTPECPRPPDFDMGFRIREKRFLDGTKLDCRDGSPVKFGTDVAIAYFERPELRDHPYFYHFDFLAQPSEIVPERAFKELMSVKDRKDSGGVGLIGVGFGSTTQVAARASQEIATVGCKLWNRPRPKTMRMCGMDPADFVEDIKAKGAKGAVCSPGKELVLHDTQTKNDACGRDSGGPLYATSSKDGKVGLIGLTVRSRLNTSGCGAGGGVYSLISRPKVLEFIDKSLQDWNLKRPEGAEPAQLTRLEP